MFFTVTLKCFASELYFMWMRKDFTCWNFDMKTESQKMQPQLVDQHLDCADENGWFQNNDASYVLRVIKHPKDSRAFDHMLRRIFPSDFVHSDFWIRFANRMRNTTFVAMCLCFHWLGSFSTWFALLCYFYQTIQ